MNLKVQKLTENNKGTLNGSVNNVAIYARESKKDPAILKNQVDNLKRYAKENNMPVFDVYQELTSAANKYYYERPEFVRLINDAKKGLFSKIIVKRRDRIARKYDDFVLIRNLFRELSIDIIYSNDIQLNGTIGYASNFIENMIMAIAQIEPDNIRNRIIDGKNTKKAMQIFDGNPSFGYFKAKVIEDYKNIDNVNDEEEEKVKEYQKDGAKADLVKDIFRIYLDNPEIINAMQVVEKIEVDIKNRNHNYKKDKEYIKIVHEKLNAGFVRDILSRPIYAALMTKSLDYKYSKFNMKFLNNPIAIDLDNFIGCINVDEIITPNEWMDSVTKWLKYNHNEVGEKSKSKDTQRHIFKNKLSCGKCGKKLRIKNNTISCGTKRCFSINKERFVREFIKALIYYLKIQGMFSSPIKKITERLNTERLKKNRELNQVKSILNERVKKYLDNSSNKELIKEIKELRKNQDELESTLDHINKKIEFLEERFEKDILNVLKQDFIDVLIDEILENSKDVVDIFVQENVKEVKINGKLIRIDGKD